MCVGMRVGMCLGMYVGVCVDMCVDMCIGTRVDMCVDMCAMPVSMSPAAYSVRHVARRSRTRLASAASPVAAEIGQCG